MPELDDVVREKKRIETELFSHPDVTAVGVGYRERAGQETDELVIRVYVAKKRPLAEVAEALRIPPEINGIRTDVIEKGPDTHTDVIGFTKRPVPCGLEISLYLGGLSWNFGTTGCFVRKDTGGSAVYLLTAAHVLDPPGVTTADDVVCQASAVLPNRIGLRKETSYGGTVDAGICLLDDGIGYSNYVWKIGNITGSGTANLRDHVMKHGRTTDYTAGKVTDIHYTTSLDGGVQLTDLLFITPDPGGSKHFCDHGDSGAPVINDARRIVGLLIGSYAAPSGITYGVACKISNVFQALHLQLADLPGGAWHDSDLSALANAPAPAAGSALATLPEQQQVFYLGTDQHVHRLWYQGGWQHDDPSASADAPAPAAGSALATLGEWRRQVFYLGTDQHVHRLWYQGGWQHDDLSASANAPAPAAGSALATLPEKLQVFYLGTDQHVHQLWYEGRWQHADLSASANAPAAAAGSALAALPEKMQVFYLGTDQHVHQLWYEGGWQHADLSARTNAPAPAAGSALATLPEQQQVFYLGTDQHVHQLWYESGWRIADLSALANAPAPAAGTALATLGTPQRQVFYLGTDQHVHRLWYESGWQYADLSALANAPAPAAGTALAALGTPQQEIFYLGTDKHVHQISPGRV